MLNIASSSNNNVRIDNSNNNNIKQYESLKSNTCPACGSMLIEDQSKGEYFCSSCGYVVLEHTPTLTLESIASSLEEKMKNTRCSGHMSYSYHDLGVSTDIAYANKDFNGKSIKAGMFEQVTSIRRWHSRLRITSSRERRLYSVLTKINEICSNLALPKIVNEGAALLYREIEGKSSIAKGRSVVCIACACIYLACKQYSILRSIDEIAEAANCKKSKKLIYKYYRMIMLERCINNTNCNANSNDSNTAILAHIDKYISRLSNLLKIDTRVEKLAIDIARKINDGSIVDGKAPNGLAAAYLYMASILLGVRMLQPDISSISKVTEVTVRNRYREIISNYKIRIILKAME
jgi:Transcription initiation factor TFIIIB, Brf1 subunit/Transcription initiation factor TFIIB